MINKVIKPKERILITSTRLFHSQGYNSTGINQIIKEAKVAKATMYEHFKSKDELAIEFLNRRHLFWFNELQKHTKNKVELKEKIISSFEFIASMNKNENFNGCVFLNILSEIKTSNKLILTTIQKHKSDLREYFFKITNDKKISDLIYILFEGAIIESQLYRDNWPISKSINFLNNYIK